MSRPVLVVDDSPTQRTYLVLLLRRAGHDVIQAKSGAEAESVLAEHTPAAILLDWQLPDAEGPDLVRRWSADDRLKWVPVLMVTGHESPEHTREALQAGAVDYLRKPVDEVELEARLSVALRVGALQEELLRQATRDPLTGLLNRRAFFERMGQELERSRRHDQDLTLALLDLDHFKRVNDNHGHLVGDEVLQSFAAHLVATLRTVDIVGRYGGEEFVVLMPEVGPQLASIGLERCRVGMASCPWPEGLQVTFSCGLTTARGGDVERMLQEADAALYRAKAAGRNRLILAA